VLHRARPTSFRPVAPRLQRDNDRLEVRQNPTGKGVYVHGLTRLSIGAPPDGPAPHARLRRPRNASLALMFALARRTPARGVATRRVGWRRLRAAYGAA
jgi:hypothetical protein